MSAPLPTTAQTKKQQTSEVISSNFKTFGPAAPTEADLASAVRSHAQVQAEQALRVTERFCTNRARCKPDETAQMFAPNATLVTLNNVVHGMNAIFAALEDGQRFTHLSKYYRPWRVCANTLESMETNEATKRITTLEREGRIFIGMWFWDPRFMYVRETCIVEDNQIKLFSTQKKF
jgi:hypothetical protein